ncbi:MAG: hypothetical protein C4B58_15720 [Deltaproteobacteria bacterium]|nr:MAG: hypothetical protein C4B58_15720 [Deltaproteobacteria bacterium]
MKKFYIDFYDYDTGYIKNVYDTNIKLNPGNWVYADIYVSGLPPEGEGTVSMGFDLTFDASSLEAAGLVLPSYLMDTGRSEIIPGHVRAEAWVVPPGSDVGGDDILLATFALHCTAISVDELWLNDFDETVQWVLKDGSVLDGELFPTHIATVDNVPIPGAIWLLGSGLLGLVGTGFRRKKRS